MTAPFTPTARRDTSRAAKLGADVALLPGGGHIISFDATTEAGRRGTLDMLAGLGTGTELVFVSAAEMRANYVAMLGEAACVLMEQQSPTVWRDKYVPLSPKAITERNARLAHSPSPVSGREERAA